MSAESPSEGEREKLATVVSVRFSGDEHERVRELAARHGLSVSAYIRRAVLGRDHDSMTVISQGPSNAPSGSSAVGSYDPTGGIVVELTGGSQGLTLRYAAPR